MASHFILINIRQQMLITVQPDPNWQLSLAQLSPSLFHFFTKEFKIDFEIRKVNYSNRA